MPDFDDIAEVAVLQNTPATVAAELSSDNVMVAVSGAVYVAPSGTEAPADASTPLAAEWRPLGYLSEDGVTISPSQTDVTAINAWQESAEVRKSVTAVENTMAFTMIEVRAETLALYYGEEILAGATSYTFGGPGSGRKAFVVDVIDGDRVVRYYAPIGEVTERSETAYKNGEPIGLNVTVSVYPSAALSGRPFKAFHSEALV